MAPKFVVVVEFTVKVPVDAAATRFEPSADIAMEFQSLSGALLFVVQFSPEFVEVQITPGTTIPKLSIVCWEQAAIILPSPEIAAEVQYACQTEGKLGAEAACQV